ncbi:protein kinase, partial [Trypanosoma theileri]
MSDVGGSDTPTSNKSIDSDSSDVQQTATTPRHQSFVHNTACEHNHNDVQLNSGSRHDLNEDSPLPLKDNNINVNDNTNVDRSDENPFFPTTLPMDHQREQEGQCNWSERKPFSLDIQSQPDQGNRVEPNLNETSKAWESSAATLRINEPNPFEGHYIPQQGGSTTVLPMQTINEARPREFRRKSVEFSTNEDNRGSEVGNRPNYHHKRRRSSASSDNSLGLDSSFTTSSKKTTCSLRCWVLCPLVFILVVVGGLTLGLTILFSLRNSQKIISPLQALLVTNTESSVGQLSFSKMMQMARGTGSLYFSNNTSVNPLTDKLMPLENGMMSRLCALLRDIDPENVVYAMSAVSLTRKQAASCAYFHLRDGSYFGTTSKNGLIDDFYHIDPLTLEYAIPLEPYRVYAEPITIEQYTARHGFDQVVNIFNESLQKGEMMNASQYWVTPPRPPTYQEYVYPFLESYEDGTTGVGYLALSMFTNNMPSMDVYKANETGIRVMLVEPNATAERFLVLGNNWGQPLSNVTNVWFSYVKGDPIRFMYTDDVTDPAMREGLKHINLRDAMSVGRNVGTRYWYGGYDARITAKYVVTESGVELVLVVVVDRSYYFGPMVTLRDVTFVIEAAILLLVTVICIIFLECCMVRPLRANRSKLKMALSGTSVTTTKQRGVVLREVRELEDVCDTLRRRLNNIRTYLPDRVLAEAEGVVSQASLRYGLDSSRLRAQSSDELKQVMCSIAYVYYTPRRSRNPSDVVVEMMMQMVVCASSECDGCLEVQRPDYCVVSFGVQGKGGELAAEASRAVEFARRLRAELAECAELDGLYRVIVESGAFLSGVVSGGGRSQFVLLGRNLHHRIGGFLPQTGVVSAVTEETALLVRGRFRLLPFETVYLDADGDAHVKLHEVLDGDASTAAWEDYERCYAEAYDGMVRGDYQVALCCWDRAKTVEQSSLASEGPSCRSSQCE